MSREHRDPRLLGKASAIAFMCLLFAVAWPRSAQTQAAGDAALATTLTGTWNLAISWSAAQALLDAGIATAVAGLPPLVDGVAASQLRERTPISRRIVLSVTASRIEARFVHATFTSTPGLPTPVPVPGSGDTMEMVQLLRDGSLEQIFTTEGGRRWSTFTPNADGSRLSLSAVIHSDRLSADVRFRLPYQRAD